MKSTVTFFDFSRANRLSICRVVDDADFNQQVAWWLSGRIFGRFISLSIPWRVALPATKETP